MNPWLRGRTLNVSMALATLGLVIFRRDSITSASVAVAPGRGHALDGGEGGPSRSSDRPPAALDEELSQRVHGLAHLVQVRVHVERLFEVRQRQRRLAELQVDHAVAGQGAEVVRIALHDLVAVGERLLILAQEVVDRGALVPALGEVRAALYDLREGLGRR